MPNVAFSVTEKFAIDPILTLRAPLPPRAQNQWGGGLEQEEMVSWRVVAWQGIQSELIARILAIFISVLATADTLIHFASGLHTIVLDKSAAYAHFKQAAWFAALMIIGSITAVIWPAFCARCRYSPPAPSADNLTPAIERLWQRVVEDGPQPDLEHLRNIWRQSSLEDKRAFALIFDTDMSGNFRVVRENLATTVYRRVDLRERQVRWLSSRGIVDGVNRGEPVGNFSFTFYYHATSERALESILKSKKVEVRHEKAFRGAFVSTLPEQAYGRCILAFYRNIERASVLEHGFQVGGQDRYWAGFSHDIPVTGQTLDYIILQNGNDAECQDLERRCEQWAGRRIRVISLLTAEEYLAPVRRLNMGIPSEWPADDAMAEQIQHTLEFRARSEAEVPNEAQLRAEERLMALG